MAFPITVAPAIVDLRTRGSDIIETRTWSTVGLAIAGEGKDHAIKLSMARRQLQERELLPVFTDKRCCFAGPVSSAAAWAWSACARLLVDHQMCRIDRDTWPTEARGDMIAAMMIHSVHRLGAPSAQGEC
ncbi:hypothetical protein [Streptomyces sp. NPDC057460]|uniref:hypothetical protein n=1 Tax=Streptomyces sp. NPDC057460 TaxID=3346141 RepID=UPI0036C67CE3